MSLIWLTARRARAEYRREIRVAQDMQGDQVGYCILAFRESGPSRKTGSDAIGFSGVNVMIFTSFRWLKRK
jgi:hypothetical protein